MFYRPSCHRIQRGVAVRGSHLVQLSSDLGIFPATSVDLQQMSIWQNLQAWVDLDKHKFPHLSTFVPKLIKERNILWNNLMWNDLEVWCSWLCINIVLGLGYCINYVTNFFYNHNFNTIICASLNKQWNKMPFKQRYLPLLNSLPNEKTY